MSVVKNVFVSASVVCGAAWLSKIAVVAATGGAEADSVVIGLLWGLGLLGLLASAATGAAYLARDRSPWLRVAAALLALPVAFVLFNLADTAVKAVYQAEGWFRDELSLVILGVVVAGIGLSVMGGAATQRSVDAS